jgi:hexulose-6-phosphate isomerase
VTTIGFMQGRLSPPVDGRIQAFPWAHWEAEFATAGQLGFPLMEWTLDEDRLDDNPLMTAGGRDRIGALVRASGVRVESLTGDFLMHAPPVRAAGADRERRIARLERVIEACGEAGVRWLVWPLVDGGRLECTEDEDAIVGIVTDRLASRLAASGVRIVFESDYPPDRLARFIARFPDETGINYDTGNSAALGFAPREELGAYGARVRHVHIKDRLRGGTTVPLGQGSAVFPDVVAGLRAAGYDGAYILQTARAADDDHAGALTRHRDFLRRLLETP